MLNPHQGLIDKINKYSEKLDDYQMALRERLKIWYGEDLSDTYFSVIPKDVLIIVKRMVPIYVRICVDDQVEPECLLEYCSEMTVASFKFVRDSMHVSLLVTCGSCGFNQRLNNGEIYCKSCGGDNLSEFGRDKVNTKEYLLIYYCKVCSISFALVKGGEEVCGGVWFGECIFIEAINGGHKRALINGHIYKYACPLEMISREIESITTSRGVYKVV